MNSPAQPKIGRNDPCPCGSGRKYKACCLAAEAKFQSGATHNPAALQARARNCAAGGDFAGAELWFRELLAARPNDAEALAGIGQTLCWRNRRKAGLEFLRRAAKVLERHSLKQRNPELILQLSSQLQHWGDMDTAIALARLALRIVPESPYALNNLVLCLSRINRNEEALPLSRKVCEQLPDEPACQILLALLESRAGQTDDARKRLESVIAGERDPVQTARAHLELGGILDKAGEVDAAFAALSTAAQMHRQLPEARGFDGNQVFRSLERNRAGFDRELLNRWPVAEIAADGLPAPVFLLGFLRSGTTLTERILDAHPDVMATDENGILFELNLELAQRTGIRDDAASAVRACDLAAIRDLRRHYWERTREEYGEAAMRKVFVDKNALNTIELGLIGSIFPDAKILFALRDPRDVCLSCFTQAFSPAPATVNLLSWEGIARQYAVVMDFWLAIRPSLQTRCLELRYEDTVTEFEATYRRVFEFLDVPWYPAVSRFHEQSRDRFISTPSFAAVSQPVYRSAVGRWRAYAAHLEPLMATLQPYIERFGYV